MSTLRAASVLSVLLFLNLTVFCSVGEKKIITITAKSGQNVILPCRAAENKPVIVLEWIRTDLGEDEFVYLYQDGGFNYQHQHPAYRGRVDLQDKEMKDGDVSLVLKNVMINDGGTYECRVVQRENNRMKRSYFFSDLICIINLEVSPPGETNIRAEPGQNVILPCRAAENKHVIVLVWSRTDLRGYEHVALYRDDQFDYEGQHPAYRDRVDLQDRKMKDGNVSLVLKNVMINDNGTYECRVDYSKNKRRKRSHLDSDPICIINLEVFPPPRNKGKQDDHEKNNNGPTVGLSVGVSIVVLALVGGGGVLGFLLYKRQRRPQQERKAHPAAGEELRPVNAENGCEAEEWTLSLISTGILEYCDRSYKEQP